MYPSLSLPPARFALPFADRARHRMLSERFSVPRVPAVVVLDLAGVNSSASVARRSSGRLRTITTRAAAQIRKDPLGERFPWLPVTIASLLAHPMTVMGGGVVSSGGGGGGGDVANASFLSIARTAAQRGTSEGEFVALPASHLGGKKVLLYFCSRSSQACRAFTPLLQVRCCMPLFDCASRDRYMDHPVCCAHLTTTVPCTYAALPSLDQRHQSGTRRRGV